MTHTDSAAAALSMLDRMRCECESRLELLAQLREILAGLKGCGLTAEIDEGDLVLVIPLGGPAAPATAAPNDPPPPTPAPSVRLDGGQVPAPETDPADDKIEAEQVATRAAAAPRQYPKGAEWTPEDERHMVAMRGTGADWSEIGQALGRSANACSVRWYTKIAPRLREAEAVPAEAGAPERAPGPDPVPGWLRTLRAHLDALGHDDGWTPTRDRDLVRMLSGGWSTARAAEALGIQRDALVARFRALCPEPTPETQRRLLAELELRAGATA
jgi:hypothetical protein